MIYLAFPGTGKTPLSKKNAKYLDLDFGYFRSALKVQKQAENQLLPAFARLVRYYENDGFIVLTNEPKLMEYTRVSRMYLPQNVSFSSKKMGVSKETVTKWIRDWETLATRFGVPVVYLKTGLDHYLS